MLLADDNSQEDPLGGISEAQIVAALGQEQSNPTPPALLHGKLTPASVLIPFLRFPAGWHILFTRRTDRVETHKGQVAFPGGSADRSDRDPDQTALRETFEETGILPQDVRILGRMAEFPTFTGFLITPVIGIVSWPQTLKLEEAEVSRAFTVPLSWLASSTNYELRPYLRPNGEKEMVVFYHLYDTEQIWGVTGRIMLNLIHLLKK